MENQPPITSYHAGFIAVAGRPNVGKSTLINQLMGQKIAAVTPRPQTTRRQQYAILTTDEAQLIFVDTPGIHKARHKLGKRMNEEAASVLEDVDIHLIIVDGSVAPTEEENILSTAILETASRLPKVLVLNKSDLANQETMAENQVKYLQLFPTAKPVTVSALEGTGVDTLVSLLQGMVPSAPPFFPEDQITDLYEREISADLIREAALYHLRDEVPHAIAIRIDEFKERGNTGALIQATIFVERESQKGIVIGRKGYMLKRIGMHARDEIESMTGRKVYLEIRVKVRNNWRNDDGLLDRFGFATRKR